MAQEKILSGKELFAARLGLGLIQGLALYVLYHAQNGAVWTWPATNGLVFAPLLLCWAFAPLLANSAFGEMRWRRALAWTLIAALVLAILAICDVWSAWPQDWVSAGKASGLKPHILPSPQLFVFGGAGLFIAHALVVAGHIDGRFRASYPTHFDIAWKLAVQGVLAAAFVGAFWLMLVLGSGLFNLIKLDFFKRLVGHDWFAVPVTAFAVAAALHLTDIRPSLVRGARTLALGLLSWLLPLLTLIVGGFLASLPFTGLAPLWSVGHASALLLGASAALIILINAAHQDGEAERLPPAILQISASVAAVLPLPLSLLAAYALYLRVHQYGWSADRVIVAACVLVAVTYAVGYLRAVWPREPWLTRIEAWNFQVALLFLAVLIALLTPIASPFRIAVADQMARLESGKIAPEKFDIAYLRREGGRYGKAALEELTASKSALLRERAQNILKQTDPNRASPLPQTPQSLAARIAIYPKSEHLPGSFLTAMTNGKSLGQLDCRDNCEAVLTDLDGDGKTEILVFSPQGLRLQIFREGSDGWGQAGQIVLPSRCTALLDALRSGHFTLAPPEPAWKDIVVGGVHFYISDNIMSGHNGGCPKP